MVASLAIGMAVGIAAFAFIAPKLVAFPAAFASPTYFAVLGARAVLGRVSPPDPHGALGGEWRDDVERFAESLLEAQLVPGMGIAVTQGDRVVYSRAFGFADAASGRRADEGTAFYIASSTKALTATAVLALSARRELDLDASIAHYLPALRGRGRLNAGSVTLRDLLTMSHGIEGGGQVEFRTAYSGTFSPGLLLELLAEYRQSDQARQFRYGNLGYNILGLVLDPRQGHGWKDVVRREVLDWPASSPRMPAVAASTVSRYFPAR